MPLTGAELADAIRRAAHAVGRPLSEFAAPLSTMPADWVNQLAKAKQPKPHTVERIRALLAGEPVPPAIPNSPRPSPIAAEVRAEAEVAARRRAAAQSTGSAGIGRLAARAEPDEAAPPPSVDRTPCPACGVRADVGCVCGRAAPLIEVAAGRIAVVPPRPRGRPRTFEEQMAAVAAGARLIEVAPMKRRPDPAGTLGGVGSAML